MSDELDPKRIPQHRIRSFRETYFSEDAAASPVNHVGPEVAGFDPLLVRALRWRARKGTLPRATKVPDDRRAALDARSTLGGPNESTRD